MAENYEQPQNNYNAQGGSNANTAYLDLDGLVSDEHRKYEPLIRGLGPVENILLLDPQSMSAMPEDYQKILYAGIAYRLAELRDRKGADPMYGNATANVLDALINMYADKAGLTQYLGQSFKEEFEKPCKNSQTPHKSALNIAFQKGYSKPSKDNLAPIYRQKDKVPNKTSG